MRVWWYRSTSCAFPSSRWSAGGCMANRSMSSFLPAPACSSPAPYGICAGKPRGQLGRRSTWKSRLQRRLTPTRPRRYKGSLRLAQGFHTLVTIPALPSATVGVGSGSMVGTAITKVLRGPGAVLSVLVLCAAPAAAQFPFPSSPPPPTPVPAPNASPAPNAATRSKACLRLESQLAAVDRGAAVDPAKAEQIKRYEDAAAKQQAELDRLGQQSQRLGCQGGGFFALFSGQSPQCGPLNNQIQQMRANLDRTLTDIQRVQGNSGEREGQRRGILVALGQNDCGPQYRQYVTGGPGGFFDALFGGVTPAPNAPLAGTYRTLCVRTCDGYYFPISYSTVPGKFADD